MKKKDQIEALTECVVVELTIECENCREGELAGYMDEDDFAKALYKLGWRYKDGFCLCPKCAKQKKQ